MDINSESLRKLRDNKGLSQKEFAKFLGISERSYQNYEGGKPIPEAKVALISSKLDVKNAPIVKKELSIEELIAQRVSELVKKELKERDAYVEKVLKELMESIIHLIPLVDQMSRKLDKIERDINEGKDLIRNKKM